MIQTVKIAQKENWCSACLIDAIEHGVNVDSIIGMSVDILTESMQPHWSDGFEHLCNGRIWQLTAESTARCNDASMISPLPPGATSWLCEHVLEMD